MLSRFPLSMTSSSKVAELGSGRIYRGVTPLRAGERGHDGGILGKLDEVEDRRGRWIKPAAWSVCAIGGSALCWAIGRAVWRCWRASPTAADGSTACGDRPRGSLRSSEHDPGVWHHLVALAPHAREQRRERHVHAVALGEKLAGQLHRSPALAAPELKACVIVGEVAQADRHGRER